MKIFGCEASKHTEQRKVNVKYRNNVDDVKQ